MRSPMATRSTCRPAMRSRRTKRPSGVPTRCFQASVSNVSATRPARVGQGYGLTRLTLTVSELKASAASRMNVVGTGMDPGSVLYVTEALVPERTAGATTCAECNDRSVRICSAV